jgi:hypothetical protein
MFRIDSSQTHRAVSAPANDPRRNDAINVYYYPFKPLRAAQIRWGASSFNRDP